MFDHPTPESTRRADVPCRSILLADGVQWYFLRPSARLSPRVVVETDPLGRRVERIALDVNFGYPRVVESLIAELRHACEHEGVTEQYEAFFALAAELILQVHDISLQIVCELLDMGEEKLSHLVNAVIYVISEPRNPLETNSPEVSRHEPF